MLFRLGFILISALIFIFLPDVAPAGGLAKRSCAALQFRQDLLGAQGSGITLRNGKVIGRNGDPVVAAFDLDDTFFRAIKNPDEARALRRKGHHVVTLNVHGVKLDYEVIPGMVEVLQDLENLGIRPYFYSAGDPERNRLLLKAVRVNRGKETLYAHVQERMVPLSEVRMNLDPLSTRAEVLKSLRPLGHDAAGLPAQSQVARPHNAATYEQVRRARVDLHNTFIVDNLKDTSIHEIWIPSPREGGPPFDWPYRRQYLLGLLSNAVELSVKNPGMSLGAALKQVQSVNLLDKAQWADNPLIRRGKILLQRSR